MRLLSSIVGLAVAVACCAPTIRAAEISYQRRLTLPAAGDALEQPLVVHADLNTGEVFVADRRTHRIVIFDADGLMRYQIRGGLAFRAPMDLAVDPDGYIVLLAYRAGKQAVLVLDFDGLFLEEIKITGLPDDALEPDLVSLALASAGDRLYLADRANLQLWIANRSGVVEGSFDLAPDTSEEEAREIQLGHVDVYDGSVLVSMPNSGSVILLDEDGTLRRRVGIHGTAPCTTARPVAAAMDSSGRVIVVDRQRMVFMVWDPESNRCLGDHSGIGRSPGALYAPADLALDASGRIYVSQGFEGRVQVYGGAIPATANAEKRP